MMTDDTIVKRYHDDRRYNSQKKPWWQTIQKSKETMMTDNTIVKRTKKYKGQTIIYKTCTRHRKLKIAQRESHQKTGSELGCSGRVGSSCCTCGTRRFTFAINPTYCIWVYTQTLVLCVMFCRSLFVLLSFFFPLCVVCSSLILRILITPLVSSNSSCRRSIWRSNGFFNKKKSILFIWPFVINVVQTAV